jgi:hypothetical protein
VVAAATPFVAVGVFVVGFGCGWLVGVVRHRKGRITVTVVSDADPPPPGAQ